MMGKVKLRAMEPEDLELLYRIENDRSLWDVGTTNVPYSRFLLHDFIASSTGDIYKDGQVRLVIENDCQDVVGLADLMNFDARNNRAEVGIVIERPHRMKGYASQSLELLVDYARRVLHIHQLYAVISSDNKVSRSLFRKHGFTVSAEMADWLFDGEEYHSALLLQKVLVSFPNESSPR